MHFQFQFHPRLGHVHGEEGCLYVDVSVHTDGTGHALVSGTIGVQEAERRLRDAVGHACDDLAREIERGIVTGTVIE